jgi:hypothetical protein
MVSAVTDEAFRALLGDREKLLELVAALREHGLRLTEAGTVELIPSAPDEPVIVVESDSMGDAGWLLVVTQISLGLTMAILAGIVVWGLLQ